MSKKYNMKLCRKLQGFYKKNKQKNKQKNIQNFPTDFPPDFPPVDLHLIFELDFLSIFTTYDFTVIIRLSVKNII